MKSRRAFSLLEIMVALIIVTGPLLVAVGSIDAGARASRFNANHLALELLVTDLADQLCAEAADRLADLGREEGDALVRELAAQRLAALPDDATRQERRKDAAAMRAIELRIESAGARELRGLYRVEVVARSATGGVVRALRLVHVPPRPPAGPPPARPNA